MDLGMCKPLPEQQSAWALQTAPCAFRWLLWSDHPFSEVSDRAPAVLRCSSSHPAVSSPGCIQSPPHHAMPCVVGIAEPGARCSWGAQAKRTSCPEAGAYHLWAALLSTDSEGEHFSLPVPTQPCRLSTAYTVSSNLMLELRERCLG